MPYFGNLAAAILMAGLSSAWAADVHRCTEGGKRVYSDRPCPDGATATVAVPARATDPAAANPQHEANMGRLAVGQTPLQVEMVWGRPRAKNVETGSSGRTEQWVYDRGDGTAYVYFRKGVLASYSEHVDAVKAAIAAPPAPEPTQLEIDSKERADKAAERRFIRERTASSDVRKRIGEPDARIFRGLQECWWYTATRLDPQTNTRICYDLNGSVFDVERIVVR